jgi:NAD(P)-dependent dehydrogenase (short-subunit alcohol dehydrogenase family)
MQGRLAGKRALVTGSTRGIGEAIATMFGAQGAHVAVTGRTAQDGERVAKAIVQAGGQADFIALDLADEQSVADAISRAVELLGGLDVLVNNAAPTEHIRGMGENFENKADGPVAEMTTERWRRVTTPGIDGLVWTIRYAMPELLKAPKASIVNISSLAGVMGMKGQSAYVATKGAMNALTRAVAADYAPTVRCNALVSGAFMTPGMAVVLSAAPQVRKAFEASTLVGYVGDPSEMAAAATFFASDESSYITGQCLPVDGGQSIKFVEHIVSPE